MAGQPLGLREEAPEKSLEVQVQLKMTSDRPLLSDQNKHMQLPPVACGKRGLAGSSGGEVPRLHTLLCMGDSDKPHYRGPFQVFLRLLSTREAWRQGLQARSDALGLFQVIKSQQLPCGVLVCHSFLGDLERRMLKTIFPFRKAG